MIGKSLMMALDSYFSKYKKADKTSVIAYCESQFGFKKDGGNAIEQLITEGSNKHRLGDMEFTVEGLSAAVDIKSVRENKASCPKLYNVDKFLRSLSRLRHHFIFFVFISEEGDIVTNLVNVLDEEMIELTRIQHHWAGRMSRGVTQLDGKFHNLVAENWRTTYSLDRAKDFVDYLIAIE